MMRVPLLRKFKECLNLATRRLRATRWVLLLLFCCSACGGRGHWLVFVLFRLRWARPVAFFRAFFFHRRFVDEAPPAVGEVVRPVVARYVVLN